MNCSLGYTLFSFINKLACAEVAHFFVSHYNIISLSLCSRWTNRTGWCLYVPNILIPLLFIPLRFVHLNNNNNNKFSPVQQTNISFPRLNLLLLFKYTQMVVWHRRFERSTASIFTVTELRLGRRVNLPGHNSIILLWRLSKHNCTSVKMEQHVPPKRLYRPTVLHGIKMGRLSPNLY
jgi:hypothetical protein